MDNLSKNIRELLQNGEKIYYKNNHVSIINYFSIPIELGTADDYTDYIFLDKRYGLYMNYDSQSNQTTLADLSKVKEVLQELVNQQNNALSLTKF